MLTSGLNRLIGGSLPNVIDVTSGVHQGKLGAA
jgi:hypothetical protein